MSYIYDYPHFALTVDTVLFSKDDACLSVLLIRRAHEPFKDRWAFPGGYVNIDEVADNAVMIRRKVLGKEMLFLIRPSISSIKSSTFAKSMTN
ncbi:MAG: NUDIX domain-containing protein [Bacteroidota bacterium]